MTADEAWKYFQNRGVILPGFQGEIAERRQIAAEWAEQGVPLQ